MKGTWRVARREYRAYLGTPWCYGVAVAFLALTGITFFVVTDAAREASLRLWFPNLAFVNLVTIPVVTSRTLAEEKRTRHLDVLLAGPVTPAGIVVGKWLAVQALFVSFLLPTLVVLVASIFETDGQRNANQMYVDELHHFLSCVNGQEKPICTLQDAIRIQEVIFAAKTSARMNMPVRLNRETIEDLVLPEK